MEPSHVVPLLPVPKIHITLSDLIPPSGPLDSAASSAFRCASWRPLFSSCWRNIPIRSSFLPSSSRASRSSSRFAFWSSSPPRANGLNFLIFDLLLLGLLCLPPRVLLSTVPGSRKLLENNVLNPCCLLSAEPAALPV